MAAVGHTLDTSTEPPRTHLVGSNIHLASEFIPSFIMNDDQNGIYLKTEIHEAPENGKSYRAELYLTVGTHTLTGYCRSILVPFPPEVLFPGNTALRFASFWLQRYVIDELIENRPLVIRCFLIRSDKYKESYLKQCDTSSKVTRRFISIYRSTPLPRYIWVSEYGYLDDWKGADLKNLLIQGELIFDASLSPAVATEWLCMHLPGSIMRQRVVERKMKVETFPLYPKCPYSCQTDPSTRP